MNRLSRRTSSWTVAAVIGLAVSSALSSVAHAEDVIPIKVIGNLIVAECTLQSPATGIPSYVLIDLGSSVPLQLHQKTAQALELTAPATPIEVSFGSAASVRSKITVQRTAPVSDEKLLEGLTAKYAEQLSEIPVGGVIGLTAFPGQILQVDVAAGVIRFGTPAADWTGFGIGNEFTYRETAAGLLIASDVESTDPELPKVAITTARYEGLASNQTIEKWKIGKPDARPLTLGTIDVASYSAFRVAAPPGTGADQPDAALGTQFVSQFRLQINTAARRLALEPLGKPIPVADDQAALLALSTGDTNGIEAYLKSHKDSWLASELGLEVLKRRTSDRSATPQQLADAILLFVDGVKDDKKAAALISYADALIRTNDPNRDAAIATTLDLASQYSTKDLNGSAVHQINARRGFLAMRKGDLKEARRHLLSASFGLPRDPQINLMLGSLYRKLNQPARAWSKYIDATLVKNPPSAAFKALAELNDDVAFRSSFGGGDAELLLEGRVPSFSPPQPRLAEQRPAARVVEFFADTQASKAVGPQLAFNGLREFFAGTPVTFIAYHLDEQLSNPLAAERAKAYGVTAPATLLADGQVIGDKTGVADDAESLYDAYLPKLLQTDPNASATETSQLALTATTQDRTVTTTVRYTPTHSISADADLRLRVLLCEQRVFVPYGPVPIQYAVARAEFTPEGGARITGPIGPTALSLHVDRLLAHFELDPDRLERQASRTDTRELQVVAFVEDAKTHRILDAISITPEKQP